MNWTFNVFSREVSRTYFWIQSNGLWERSLLNPATGLSGLSSGISLCCCISTQPQTLIASSHQRNKIWRGWAQSCWALVCHLILFTMTSFQRGLLHCPRWYFLNQWRVAQSALPFLKTSSRRCFSCCETSLSNSDSIKPHCQRITLGNSICRFFVQTKL